VVSPQAPPATKPDAPPPPRAATTPEKVAPIPTKTPARADPAPPATPAPPTAAKPTTPPQQAGGGETGGKGTDVANVRTEGIAFPYPGYLQNVVRQVALCFEPPRGTDRLRADVAFQVMRTGDVSEIRMVTPSGNYRFDNEAKAAIECAQVKFGALPAGFRDDVLPIVFSFDPSLLK
jgi:periplasmic protein TonB